MPTQKQLDNALLIAECGSFFKASERLFISSSALIQQINLMESEIGFKLFERTKKGIKVTEAGKHYLDQMKQLGEQVTFITETARKMAESYKRILRIGHLPGQSSQIGIELSYELRKAFKELSVELVPVTIEAAIEGLLSGKLDCCVMPIVKTVDPEVITSFVIRRSTLMIGITPELEIAKKEKMHFEDFRNQRIILPKRGIFETGDLFEERLNEKGIPFTRIDQDDHVEAELLCFEQQGCRINGSVIEGSRLVYRPLEEDITFNMHLVYKIENYEMCAKYLAYIKKISK